MPETNQAPKTPERRRRLGAVRAALAMIASAAAGGLVACLGEPPPRPPAPAPLPVAAAPPAVPAPHPQPSKEETWKQLSEREVIYLQQQLDQIRRWEGRPAGESPQPLASGALAAAALASQGGPEAPRLRQEAARFAAGALDQCDRWTTNKCARAQLPLERLVLQYPRELPAALVARLRAKVADSAPAPGEAQVRNPWSFADTENQRMITMSRSLVGQVVAGTPDSPTARGWGDFAVAFLEAHDRDGWYEAESPGYLALSITGLLQLADLAPQPAVRELARRQLDVLFATWAQEQVGGYPAGPKVRTSAVWSLSRQSSPWQSWAWLAAGTGDPAEINFADRGELPVSHYQIPEGVVRLLTDRRRQPPYEIRAQRRIQQSRRRPYDAALYAYATPDYILGVSQSVQGLALHVSGGQEIVATLYAESPAFAPVYLWSRTRTPESDDAAQLNTLDRAAASRNVVLARLDTPGAGLGHAFLAPPWSAPEVMGDVVVSRCGDAYVALVTAGGWETAPATDRFPDYYGTDPKRRRDLAGSWVAVPRRQPASVALVAGRRAEDGDFAAWKKKAAAARLSISGDGGAGEDGEIHFTGIDGARADFLPGRRARFGGSSVEAAAYPRMEAPFLSSPSPGRWSFSFDRFPFRFEPVEGPRPRPAP
ncbi:MAG TPA: hypothetical protein VGH73_19325 [Thermoanaerobaculia bacterium]